MKTKKLRGVCVGAGYFSRFHYDAWNRMSDIEIIANCDRLIDRAVAVAREFDIPRSYPAEDFQKLLANEQPDFVDLITPPDSHLELCQHAIDAGVAIVCQKPLAPTWEESNALARLINSSNMRFMVHENWRWQPWYRQLKILIDDGAIGEVFHCSVFCRMGDGWGEDAYLARQPFFRDYQRLFIFETGVHFLDTFRFLFGEVHSIFAQTARRNPVIKGEDSALIFCKFDNGTTAVLDANRYNESESENPRYTFGTVRIEGSKGHLELDFDGKITLKRLGHPPTIHPYDPPNTGFAGDCVFAVQRHFVDCLKSSTPFESTADDYLKSIRLVEAAYASANSRNVVIVQEQENKGRFSNG